MSEKTFRVTVEVTIHDLPPDERPQPEDGEDQVSIDDISPTSFGHQVSDYLGIAEDIGEFWGGSEMYGEIRAVKLISAEEVTP